MRLAYELGFRSIIVNRPDGEELDQPTTAEMQQAASDCGLELVAIPVTAGAFTDQAVISFADAMQRLKGPVIAYCRSGLRAASLWALSQAPALGPKVVLSAAESIGYDLSQLLKTLERPT